MKNNRTTIDRQSKNSIFWKIYFYTFLGMLVLGSVDVLRLHGVGLVDFVGFALSAIGVLGLFGYVFRKPILFPKFWLVFLPTFLAFTAAYPFITKTDLPAGMTGQESLWAHIVTFIICLPGYAALFFYSREDQLWE